MHYIYRITNIINGNTYVGQHKPRRKSDIASYLGSGTIIRRAVAKYGREFFTKEILHNNIESQELADKLEKYWISYERLCGRAQYNIQDGGNLTGGSLFLGHHHSASSKEKISASSKKRWSDPCFRDKMLKVRKKQCTEETRQKMSKANKGKKRSSTFVEKLRQRLLHNELTKNSKWFNNGQKNIRIKDGDTVPDGFRPGRTYHKRINK